MAKSKNHTTHHQSRKDHRKGIGRPKKKQFESSKYFEQKYAKNLRFVRRNNASMAAEKKRKASLVDTQPITTTAPVPVIVPVPVSPAPVTAPAPAPAPVLVKEKSKVGLMVREQSPKLKVPGAIKDPNTAKTSNEKETELVDESIKRPRLANEKCMSKKKDLPVVRKEADVSIAVSPKAASDVAMVTNKPVATVTPISTNGNNAVTVSKLQNEQTEVGKLAAPTNHAGVDCHGNSDDSDRKENLMPKEVAECVEKQEMMQATPANESSLNQTVDVAAVVAVKDDYRQHHDRPSTTSINEAAAAAAKSTAAVRQTVIKVMKCFSESISQFEIDEIERLDHIYGVRKAIKCFSKKSDFAANKTTVKPKANQNQNSNSNSQAQAQAQTQAQTQAQVTQQPASSSAGDSGGDIAERKDNEATRDHPGHSVDASGSGSSAMTSLTETATSIVTVAAAGPEESVETVIGVDPGKRNGNSSPGAKIVAICDVEKQNAIPSATQTEKPIVSASIGRGEWILLPADIHKPRVNLGPGKINSKWSKPDERLDATVGKENELEGSCNPCAKPECVSVLEPVPVSTAVQDLSLKGPELPEQKPIEVHASETVFPDAKADATASVVTSGDVVDSTVSIATPVPSNELLLPLPETVPLENFPETALAIYAVESPDLKLTHVERATTDEIAPKLVPDDVSTIENVTPTIADVVTSITEPISDTQLELSTNDQLALQASEEVAVAELPTTAAVNLELNDAEVAPVSEAAVLKEMHPPSFSAPLEQKPKPLVPLVPVESSVKTNTDAEHKLQAGANATCKLETDTLADTDAKALLESAVDAADTAVLQAAADAKAAAKLQAEADAAAKLRAEADAVATAKLQAGADAETAAKLKAEADAAAKLQAEADAEAAAKLQAEADAAAKLQAEADAEAATKLQAEADAEAAAKLKAEADAAAKFQAEADAVAAAKLQAEADAAAKLRAEADAVAAAKLQAEADAESAAKLKAEADAAAKLQADADAEAAAKLQAEADAAAKLKLEADAEAAAKLQAEADAAAKLQAEADAEAAAKLQAEAVAAAKLQAEAVAAAKLQAEADAEAAAKLQAEADAAAKLQAVADAEAAAKLQAEADAEAAAKLQAEADAAANLQAEADAAAAAKLEAEADAAAKLEAGAGVCSVVIPAANSSSSVRDDLEVKVDGTDPHAEHQFVSDSVPTLESVPEKSCDTPVGTRNAETPVAQQELSQIAVPTEALISAQLVETVPDSAVATPSAEIQIAPPSSTAAQNADADAAAAGDKAATDNKFMWELFDLVDVDGSGNICLEELRIVLSAKGYSDNFVEHIFCHLDLNKDGVVTQEEFFDALKFVPAEIFAEEGVVSDDRLLRYFDEFDVDKNGTVELCELTKTLRERGISEKVIASYFRHLDVNGDYEISREEYARCIGIEFKK